MTRADLTFATMLGTDLAQATLRRADLSTSRFTGSTFEGADLTEANIQMADGGASRFRGAIMQKVHCRGTSLICSDLSNCDLTRARMHGTDLAAADLSGTTLDARARGGLRQRADSCGSLSE